MNFDATYRTLSEMLTGAPSAQRAKDLQMLS